MIRFIRYNYVKPEEVTKTFMLQHFLLVAFNGVGNITPIIMIMIIIIIIMFKKREKQRK